LLVLVAFSFLHHCFLETTLNTPKDKPIDALVAEIVDQLDDDLREEFEERAAIIEFDAHVLRAHAECLALLYVLRRYPFVLMKIKR
jgi:hypothetical protein